MATMITVGSSKGGSGKTTMSILLSGELANQGFDVLILDTDIQQSTYKWFKRCAANNAAPSNVQVIASDAHKEITDIINKNSGKDIILVDTAGFAAELTFKLARASDLFVLPCKISSLDAVEVLDFINTMRKDSRTQGLDIPHYKVVLNEYDPIVKGAKSFENVHQLLIGNGVVVSDILLQKRERFKQVTEGLGSLYQIKTGDKATENAQVNVRNLVFDLFQGDKD